MTRPAVRSAARLPVTASTAASLGTLVAGVAMLLSGAPARADGCAAVCEDPARVAACNEGRPVWGFREPDGVCRGGSFGYLESREAADAERLRIARSHKRTCDETGNCDRFRALDEASVVCLACDSASRPPEPARPDPPTGGRPPPCEEDEWLRSGQAGEPARCFVEFAVLPPRLALQGRCTEGDCRDGEGTVRWPTGESYVGGFHDGRRHGQGSFRWPDERMYIGEWRDGQPDGLGTRIFAEGRYKAGYFGRGRYLGTDPERAARARGEAAARPAGQPRPASDRKSCEESCTEDAELTLGRINDEYECCFARHAFCSQKARIAGDACADRRCSAAARQQQDDCDLHYACDAVQTEKVQRFRRQRAACVEGCASQELDEHGLRVSERGTLLDD